MVDNPAELKGSTQDQIAQRIMNKARVCMKQSESNRNGATRVFSSHTYRGQPLLGGETFPRMMRSILLENTFQAESKMLKERRSMEDHLKEYFEESYSMYSATFDRRAGGGAGGSLQSSTSSGREKTSLKNRRTGKGVEATNPGKRTEDYSSVKKSGVFLTGTGEEGLGLEEESAMGASSSSLLSSLSGPGLVPGTVPGTGPGHGPGQGMGQGHLYHSSGQYLQQQLGMGSHFGGDGNVMGSGSGSGVLPRLGRVPGSGPGLLSVTTGSGTSTVGTPSMHQSASMPLLSRAASMSSHSLSSASGMGHGPGPGQILESAPSLSPSPTHLLHTVLPHNNNTNANANKKNVRFHSSHPLVHTQYSTHTVPYSTHVQQQQHSTSTVRSPGPGEGETEGLDLSAPSLARNIYNSIYHKTLAFKDEILAADARKPLSDGEIVISMHSTMKNSSRKVETNIEAGSENFNPFAQGNALRGALLRQASYGPGNPAVANAMRKIKKMEEEDELIHMAVNHNRRVTEFKRVSEVFSTVTNSIQPRS